MTEVANCKKCGALFIQTSKQEICDKCLDKQNKMINDIISYVINAPEAVSVDVILEKYSLSRNEFDALFIAGKFVKISAKITINCARCGKTVIMGHRTNFLCDECSRKLQNEI